MTVDRIFLKGLSTRARHGALAAERALGQTFILDVELDIALEAASRSDRLVDTVDYGKLAGVVLATFAEPCRHLIEAAAGQVADAVLAFAPQAAAVRVTVHKPSAPIDAIFDTAGVAIERRR